MRHPECGYPTAHGPPTYGSVLNNFFSEGGRVVSFLMMLTLAPVMWWVTWIYMSPLHRLDGHFWVKLVVRVVLCVIVLGGLFAQLGFLVHGELSLHARRFYLGALLLIEGVPILAIVFYRYYRDPSSYGDDSSGRI